MRGAPPPHSVCLSPKTPRAEVPDPRPPCMPVPSGEVPDPRPELSIAINMEIVLASSVWDVVTTAAGGKLLMAAFDGAAGAELLGTSARWEGGERGCLHHLKGLGFRVQRTPATYGPPFSPHASLAHLHPPQPSRSFPYA